MSRTSRKQPSTSAPLTARDLITQARGEGQKVSPELRAQLLEIFVHNDALDPHDRKRISTKKVLAFMVEYGCRVGQEQLDAFCAREFGRKGYVVA